MLVRPQYLIEENLYNNQPDIDYWRNKFSMGKETFLQICQILHNGDNFDHKPIIVEKRVAIALSWLALGNSYHSVGVMFGMHGSTVFKFVT